MYAEIVRGAWIGVRLAASYFVLARRFVALYWGYVAAVTTGALAAWLSSDAASDYTKGGWELHFEQRAWGLDLHVHHWYYGLPLVVLAFVMLHRRPYVSVFLFVFGQTVAAHSYHNEGGIASIFEGAPVLRVPAFVYWPVASLLVALYTFFVVRAHEWLTWNLEREEAAVSFLCERERVGAALDELDAWCAREFERGRAGPLGAGARGGSYTSVERNARGLWECHYKSTPFDDGRSLVTLRVEHVPHRAGSVRLLDLLARGSEILARHAAAVGSAAPAPALDASTNASGRADGA